MIEMHEEMDPRGVFILAALGLLMFVFCLVYGGHKYQMWRARRRRTAFSSDERAWFKKGENDDGEEPTR